MAKPRRYELQEQLVGLLGSRNVYYQPPESVKLSYPCIVYNLDNYDARYANNDLYAHKARYQVTLIDRDPDSELPVLLARRPYTSMNSTFVVDNLHHFVFTLYF